MARMRLLARTWSDIRSQRKLSIRTRKNILVWIADATRYFEAAVMAYVCYGKRKRWGKMPTIGSAV